MCVVSMIDQHYYERWKPYSPTFPPPTPYTIPPQPTPNWEEELKEFNRLRQRAKKYDKENNQPNCEMDEKRKLLKDLAKQLGLDISFIDEP